MPRNRPPRKTYRPRPPRADAHWHAIDRVATLLPHQREALTAPMQRALDAFRTGAGSSAHWDALADACNVGEELAQMRIGGDALLPVFAAAQAALAAVHAQHKERNTWTLRAAWLQALDDVTYWHGWQLEQVSQGELLDAKEAVIRRIAGVLAGNVSQHTIVCGALGNQAAARAETRTHQPLNPQTP